MNKETKKEVCKEACVPKPKRARRPTDDVQPLNVETLTSFVRHVLSEGQKHYRDFAWRQTTDPYSILLSEIMLQQTQVARVVGYYERWLERFPNIDAIAATSTSEVLDAWQGLGYNRRGLALKRLADEISEVRGGVLPASYEELQQLPGVGPATAAGVMAFAHNKFAPYLETNVRSVVLHELFADDCEVCDKEVKMVVEQVTSFLSQAQDSDLLTEPIIADARSWNYALLDYGSWLKKTFPNPSRKSKQHTKQSKFEGSFRQKRAILLREILAQPNSCFEELRGRTGFEATDIERVLDLLCQERFIVCDNDRYRIDD